MKNIKIFALFFMVIGLFSSCEDELDPKVPSDAVGPELLSPSGGGSYVLEKVNEDQVFATFDWTEADFKLPVVVEYALEVDVQGGDFSKRNILLSNIETPLEISVSDFNKGLLAAGFEEGTAHDIQVRVVANHELVTEPINMTVTPYFDVDSWTVIGSAVGGWNPENDQYMDYDKEAGVYRLTLDLSPGEFKFRAPNKDADNPWAFNLGLDGDPRTIFDEENVVLSDGGANIGTTGGNYTLILDVNAGTFTIIQNEAPELTDWTGVVLDAVGSGISSDNPDATADGSSWNWGNVLVADNEGAPTSSAGVYTWTWEGIILEANEGFKLRTLNGEPAPQNEIAFDLGYGALDVDNSSELVVDADGNLSVTEKGEYDITLVVDAINGDIKTVTITESAPATLYMIGGTIGGWDWAANSIEMIPVHSHENLYWKIVWMEAGTDGFKFSPVMDWGDDFGMAEDLGGGEYSFGGDNISAPVESGYYMVVVDLEAEKISVVEPEVYLIGDAVGSWDAANEAAKFTIDNANEKLSFQGTLNNAELRMYAWHSYFTDWWQSEFMIFDGNIEYRGNGGDQDRVNVDAGDYIIDLNFKNETGSVTLQ
ncbi:SusF/SusE family outer membrane protein [Marinilabilia rubra]|nr:SusF/SusE family outer membrane protein [Marinilabilia rubra]